MADAPEQPTPEAMKLADQIMRLEWNQHNREVVAVWIDRFAAQRAAEARASSWHEWRGGSCPLPEHHFPEVRYRSGGTTELQANRLRWTHTGAWDDIIAYRPHHVVARDGIEAQHGLNDVFPGDQYPTIPPSGDAGERAREPSSDDYAEARRIIDRAETAFQDSVGSKIVRFNSDAFAFFQKEIATALQSERTAAASERWRVADAVIEAARELIVGEQPKPFPPTIEELEAILAGDGGKVRIAPSGEVFVRPPLDRLERALTAYDRALASILAALPREDENGLEEER